MLTKQIILSWNTMENPLFSRLGGVGTKALLLATSRNQHEVVIGPAGSRARASSECVRICTNVLGSNYPIYLWAWMRITDFSCIQHRYYANVLEYHICLES